MAKIVCTNIFINGRVILNQKRFKISMYLHNFRHSSFTYTYLSPRNYLLKLSKRGGNIVKIRDEPKKKGKKPSKVKQKRFLE